MKLDLAMVHVERGETAELKRLAEEMVPIFESLAVHEKALAAVLLFRQAAEAEKVTLGLLREMATLLERTGRGLQCRPAKILIAGGVCLQSLSVSTVLKWGSHEDSHNPL